MNKVPLSEYGNYIAWAKACTSNQVYPLSIAEGNQPGDIYTDNLEQASAVLFWHFCGFAYLSGSPSEAYLEEIFEAFYLRKRERRFLLITDSSEIAGYFSGKPGITTGTRLEYQYETASEKILRTDEEHQYVKASQDILRSCDNPGYRVERISSQLLPRIQGRIIPSFSWDCGEQFLEKGLGYIVTEGESIAAVAFSAAVSSEEIDIGVETMEPFRGKGYATLLANTMCQTICQMGKRPVWAHAEQNAASGRTALASGFRVKKRNIVIKNG